jgi:hypothetical protein
MFIVILEIFESQAFYNLLTHLRGRPDLITLERNHQNRSMDSFTGISAALTAEESFSASSNMRVLFPDIIPLAVFQEKGICTKGSSCPFSLQAECCLPSEIKNISTG